MKKVQQFFIFCSGAHTSILSRTPTEYNKYVGIGATVFFTGLFAAVAGGYALFTVFSSVFISIFFGLLWGLMIFNLDRYIVSTIKKKGHFFRDILSVTPRLILAVLIAIVIAKPLELRIFQSEIDSELLTMRQEIYKEQEDLIRQRYEPEVVAAKEKIDHLKTELKSKEASRDLLLAEARAEADGTGGSGIRNMGPIYRAKKADAERIQGELDDMKAEYLPLIAEYEANFTDAQLAMKTDIENTEKSTLDGLAARINALDRISRRNEAIFYAGLFIMLLFIALETAPIFVKLITARSPYDFVLDKHEHRFAMDHKAFTTSLRSTTANQLDFQIKTNAIKTELAMKAETELAEIAVREHVERLKKQPMLWRSLLRKGKLYGLD